jgi:hypothetical protein
MQDCAPSVVEFVRKLDAAFATVVGDRLVASYLHGSAALGGFVPGRSDIDVLFIIRDDVVEDRTLHEVVDALRAAATPCPGRGVELSAVSATAAQRPTAPWPFLLHLSTDPANDTAIFGAGHGGDPNLLMHFAVCRAAGVVVRGPPPIKLIGAIDHHDVLAYLDGELDWALQNANEAYTVLNACRAMQFVERGEIVSKVDGARFMIDHGGPQDVIATALAMHVGDQPHRQPSQTARSFVGEIRRALQAARS